MEQNKLFKSFINDIIQVFPEYKQRLYKTYEYTLQETLPDDYSLENDTRLNELCNHMIEHIDDIISENDSIFQNDPLLLENVSFKIIWGSNISRKTKKSLWKYFQTFCLLHLSNDMIDSKINDVIQKVENNEKVSDKKTVKSLKYIKKLNEILTTEDINEDNDINDHVNNEAFNGMETLLENTGIGQIAKNITEELDIEKMLGDSEGIEGLFKGDNMMNIFKTINSKIESELSNDPNSKDNLMKEAGDICGNMQGNPLFSSLMGSMQGMFQGGGMPQPPPQDVKNIQMNKDPHSSNKTRQRLQKKLKEKEKLKVEKVDSES